MNRFRKIALCILLLPLAAFAGGFDRKAFDPWVDACAGSGAQVRTVEGSGMDYRRVGDMHVFSTPVFLDFPKPGGERRYQAWENYDFFIQPEGSVSEPHQLSWARVGPLPA